MPSRRLFLTGVLSVWACLPADAQGRGAEASNGKGGSRSNAGNGHRGNGNSDKDGGDNDVGNGDDGNTSGDDRIDQEPTPTPETTEPPSNQPSLQLRHQNGFEEILSGGRYHMKDNRGRTIVNRPATQADLVRLQQLTGG